MTLFLKTKFPCTVNLSREIIKADFERYKLISGNHVIWIELEYNLTKKITYAIDEKKFRTKCCLC